MEVEHRGYFWDSCWGVVGEWAHECDRDGGCHWVDAWLTRSEPDFKPVLLELFVDTGKPSPFKDDVKPKAGELIRDVEGHMTFGTDAVVNTSNCRAYVVQAIDLLIEGRYTQL